jgi:hypothetical protein
VNEALQLGLVDQCLVPPSTVRFMLFEKGMARAMVKTLEAAHVAFPSGGRWVAHGPEVV